MGRKAGIVSAVLLSVFLLSVSAGCANTKGPCLLIPIGRLAENGNKVELTIDDKPFAAAIIKDGSDGFWLKVPFDQLEDKNRIKVRFTRTNSNTLLNQKEAAPEFLSSNYLIDSDDPAIISKAAELTDGVEGNNAKAKKILEFAVEEIGFAMGPGMHYKKASDTLKDGFGICVNHSRLFVALCRAAGIPARTISGALINANDADHHHEWAEFYDDDNNWHAVDPTMFEDLDFIGLRYIDLLYDIESNPFYPFGAGWENDTVKLENGDVSVFCSNWGLEKYNGGMGYRVLSDVPAGTIEFEIEYNAKRYTD